MRKRRAGVRVWALAVSVVLHLAALTALGVVHFGRQANAIADRKPAGISVHTLERILEQPAPKPKPKIEPLPAPTVKAAVPELVPSVVEPAPQEQAEADNTPQEAVAAARPAVDAVLFCGTEMEAQRVCYVVDGSGSMFGLMYLVRQQLRESILNLSGQQSFNVLFFMQGGTFLQAFDGRMERATPAAKAEALSLLARVRPEGQTTAEQIVEIALRLRDRAGKAPEVIYLLTDGFDLMDGAGDAFVRRVENLQKKLAPATVVHTIGIYPAPQDRRILSQLAKVCGGRYIEIN